MAALIAPQDIQKAIYGIRSRPGDIIIAPYSKCGTTWLQQIFHVLRTGGDDDYDDISLLSPG